MSTDTTPVLRIDTAAVAHVVTCPAIFYLGTPVVLLSTANEDGTTNLAPISSAFWLGTTATIGISPASRSGQNLARTGEVVLALPSVEQVDAVDRLALTTGVDPVPPHKRAAGYRALHDKFGHAGLTPVPSDLIARLARPNARSRSNAEPTLTGSSAGCFRSRSCERMRIPACWSTTSPTGSTPTVGGH